MRYSLWTASGVLLALLPTWAQAQITLPVLNEPNARNQTIVYQDVSGPTEYQHGRFLRLTLKGEAKEQVSGILSRIDPKNGIIYVRTTPGAAPRAIAVRDIDRSEKGVIRQASYRADGTIPEIREMVIHNGATRTVTYDAPTLSPDEKSVLDDLQKAENELARVESLRRMEERVLENELAIQNEERRSRELANQLLLQRLSYMQAFGPFGAYGYRGLPYVVEPSVPGTTQVIIEQPVPEILVGGAYPYGAPRVTPPATTKVPLSSELLQTARRNYVAAQSRAVFENGRLVAVIVNSTPDKTSDENP